MSPDAKIIDRAAPVTGAMLYDVIQCPHRVTNDLFGDPSDRDEINPFVQLLWEKGSAYEKEVIAGLNIPFLDLSIYAGDEKERRTIEAINIGVELIYGGRIQADDLLGDPDLLQKRGSGYVAGDIKSGAGEEGDEDNKKLKKHYGVQISLYTDILERKEKSSSRTPFIWDVHGEQVVYELDEPLGVRTPNSMWDVYQAALAEARNIVSRSERTLPGYGGNCKMCHWYSCCLDELEDREDLTLIPELGRAKRDVMIDEISTLSDMAIANTDHYVRGKKTIFKGVGPQSLEKFHERAKLLTAKDSLPFLTGPVSLPSSEDELFFDIEVDPMRDICYLHGFVERIGGDNSAERYEAFFTADETEAEEERVFAAAINFIRDRPSSVIYYYSKYERTIWRKLQEKYPSVCSGDDIEDVFDPTKSVDLYFDVVKKFTEWPTKDYSIKTLATYLGFEWRDTHPSGAASIQWFDEWVRTRDTNIKYRILEYNEDDCTATRVLLDGIRNLS